MRATPATPDRTHATRNRPQARRFRVWAARALERTRACQWPTNAPEHTLFNSMLAASSTQHPHHEGEPCDPNLMAVRRAEHTRQNLNT